MLIPDGVYLTDTEPVYFRRLSAPTREEIQGLLERIGERIGRHLKLTLSFSLGRSQYATAVLREISDLKELAEFEADEE
jgi:tRNA(Glu) U13 pseudouridine synthase TruD